MSNKRLIITILILGIIFAFAGLLLALNATGVFDLKTAMADMPVIGKRFQTDDPFMIIAPLEDENKSLKKEIEELKTLLTEKEKAAENFNVLKDDYLRQISQLEEKIINLSQKDVQSAQLAQIYSKMEDVEAVRIFDNLDDDTVIGILVKISADKTASFLAAMDPIRAAKLTAVLTDKAIGVGN